VIRINALDEDRQALADVKLRDPMTICMRLSDEALRDGLVSADYCLAFYDAPNGEWLCVDRVLRLPSSLVAASIGDGALCGATPHLSLFGIIRQSDDVDTRRDAASPLIDDSSWRTALLVALLLLCCCCCVIVCLAALLRRRAEKERREEAPPPEAEGDASLRDSGMSFAETQQLHRAQMLSKSSIGFGNGRLFS
jgi:hypothetical protein